MKLLFPLIVCLSLAVLSQAISIHEYGAIADDKSIGAAKANGKAIYQAFLAANASATDRVVEIPTGTYTYVPYDGFHNLQDITMILNGVISVFDDQSQYTNNTQGDAMDVFHFYDCARMTFTGDGTIEGNGYKWWWTVILTAYDSRPNLFYMEHSTDIVIENWKLRNSPQYHIMITDGLNILIQNVDVYVDVEGQSAMLEKKGWMSKLFHLDIRIPTFPLNTDGIDVAGKNIIVRNCRVQNFDDAICIKPTHAGNKNADCTENVLIENIYISLGVGATVGSVPPNTAVNCVRNITFRNIEMDNPIKAIYIKPNPGTSGTGIIDQVTYENVYAKRPLWWSIWVSTQQQHQPGNGADTHCSFFYPAFHTKCPTQPRVPVTNLTLRNVTMVDALLSPGVLRCDPAGPCTGWKFENVNFKSLTNWPSGNQFLCEGIVDPQFINTHPLCSKQSN